MREVKFRAWFAKEKAMVQVDNLELLGRSGHAEVSAKHDFEKGGWYSPLKESTNRKTVVDGSKNQVPRVVLMQYTGLKDKNGVEIHEGDIVESNRDYRFPIFYEDGCYKTDSEDFEVISEHLITYYELKVIGNIYEHPELLEEI